MLSLKLACTAVLVVGFALWSASDYNGQTDSAGDVALGQLANPNLDRQLRDEHFARTNENLIRWCGLAALVALFLRPSNRGEWRCCCAFSPPDVGARSSPSSWRSSIRTRKDSCCRSPRTPASNRKPIRRSTSRKT